MKKLPKGMQNVAKCSMTCIGAMIRKGQTMQQAENMVMQTLEECRYNLQNKEYDFVIATLRMVYLDETPQQAAKKMIQKMLS